MKQALKFVALPLAVVVFLGAGYAHARSQYNKAFKAQYPTVKEAENAKCNVCHVPEKEKEERNIYGQTLRKLLAAENVKDETKIKETLTKAETEKSAVAGKTFGDLLKEGKLPASK